MNIFQILLSSVMLLATASHAQTSLQPSSEPNSQPKMYQEKSGYVSSTITQGFSEDKLMKITETFFWDDWGLKVAKYQIINKTQKGTKTIIRLEVDASQDKQIIVDEVAVQAVDSAHFEVPGHLKP